MKNVRRETVGRPCFAVGWDGHTPLEIPPGAITHKTMEELLGVEKLPWWWAKEGRGHALYAHSPHCS